jgi:hypothetical protein
MENSKSVWKRIQSRIGGWDLPVLVLWAVTLFCIGPFVLLQVFSSSGRYGEIPVSIHSQSEADYSQDPRNRNVPVISLNILRDLMLGGEDLEEITFLQTLTATFRPPEDTPTPQPTGTLSPQSTPTSTPSQDEPVDGTPTIFPTAPAPIDPTQPVRKTDTVPTDPPAPTTESPKPSSTTQVPTSPTTQAPPTTESPKPSETTPAPTKVITPTVIIPPTKVTPSPPPPTPKPTDTQAPKPTNTPAPKPTNTPAPKPTDTPEIPLTPITFPTKIPTKPSP